MKRGVRPRCCGSVQTAAVLPCVVNTGLPELNGPAGPAGPDGLAGLAGRVDLAAGPADLSVSSGERKNRGHSPY